MKSPSVSSEIDRALSILQSAKSSAAVGDKLGAMESLLEVHRGISKLLSTAETRETQHLKATRENVELWRSGKAG